MYDSYMSVNKKFKSSVNLQYDLYNTEKLLQYIPTTDLCDVMADYVDSVLDNGKKATLLAGPYGKGKSYLMLMITYLLSKREDKDLLNKIVSKISKIDANLANKIIDLDNKKISLLPVIINNNSSEDMNSNFLLALRNALIEHGIEDIVPNSAYLEALQIVKDWEKQQSNSFDIFSECKKSLNIDYEKLKLGLTNYNHESLDNFKKLFQCVNHGYQFNSLISSDFSVTFMDIAKKVKKYGFSGLFVVFDEFGVFLENQNQDFISRLNKIQSFAEKCETSDENSQMHFCCITHKDMSLYGTNNSNYDDFAKIAGRFKQVRFDRSLEENYQLICSAIVKGKEYQTHLTEFLNKSDIIDRYKNSLLFTNKEMEYILSNGFPFNPIALYALIQVSEKVAQNERTLFTFMSDTDINSFNYFIANNESGLLNVPSIYDYFEPLIKENPEYRLLYYKTESINKKLIKSVDREVIKCVAISKIINDNIKYACSDENIALALNITDDEAKKSISTLINGNVLKRNINDNTLDFSVISDNQFLKILDDTAASKYDFESVSTLLNDFNSNKYFVSNKYNFNNKMVRFFRSEYIDASTLKNLNNLDVYFAKEFSDGLIINLVNDANLLQKDVKSLLERFNMVNVIVRYIDKMIPSHIIKKIKRLYSAKNLLVNATSLSDDIKNALPIYIEDEITELNTFLEEFNNQAKLISLIQPQEKSLPNFIDSILTQLFPRTVIINNEQINKNEISSVTNKARMNVIDLILNRRENTYSTTSAEGTIFDSFNRSINNAYEVVDIIKNWFTNSGNKRLLLSELVDILKNPPYGMRDGVIPLFVAKAVSDVAIMNNESIKTLILYNTDLEIPLDATNLTKALSNPKLYSFSFTEINQSKLVVIKELMSIFNCSESSSFNENIIHLMDSIKSTIENLPPIIIKSNKNENILCLTNESLNFKDMFLKHDLNTYEVIFNDLPHIFKVSLKDVPCAIKKSLKEYEQKLNSMYQSVIAETIKAFGSNMDSIKSTYDLWKGQYEYINDVIFESQEKMLFRALESMKFNNKDAINLLSYSIFNCTLEDWNSKKYEDFKRVLNSFIDKVYNFDESSISKKDFNYSEDSAGISQLGKTLYSNILDTLEEYGSSLSNKEKALIIKKILSDLIN